MAGAMGSGLKSLGLDPVTDEVVPLRLSAALPIGDFKSQQSVLPGNDDLLLHGMSMIVVRALFYMFPTSRRAIGEIS